ncbi:hypothetical protein H8S33_10620 [Ornithinibacillus sp. BX22]|uniref:Uncharacterized protein n=1 Tax=Ornithinibacillus hominis TaxID=2763055 RepID=A0A923L686_9BACI|nr:hypothetical protein [Ornithinibacillus hominis]MBC5637257.1 hypothetical protein [Ornithinibacillus hominis]
MDREKLMKNLEIIERHLEKNEKWLQSPEKKKVLFEKEMIAWNTRFMKNITDIENWIKDFEKRMGE